MRSTATRATTRTATAARRAEPEATRPSAGEPVEHLGAGQRGQRAGWQSDFDRRSPLPITTSSRSTTPRSTSTGHSAGSPIGVIPPYSMPVSPTASSIGANEALRASSRLRTTPFTSARVVASTTQAAYGDLAAPARDHHAVGRVGQRDVVVRAERGRVGQFGVDRCGEHAGASPGRRAPRPQERRPARRRPGASRGFRVRSRSRPYPKPNPPPTLASRRRTVPRDRASLRCLGDAGWWR